MITAPFNYSCGNRIVVLLIKFNVNTTRPTIMIGLCMFSCLGTSLERKKKSIIPTINTSVQLEDNLNAFKILWSGKMGVVQVKVG
jgi:hypothetical protein